jgi:hypothetical protein
VATTRIVLAGFVLAWIFGPPELQWWVPIWIVFAIAAGLEVHFFVQALRSKPGERPDRGPQDVDRERYGYGEAPADLLLVREGGTELWIPYAGEEGADLEALIAEARDQPERPDEAAGPFEPELAETRSPWEPVRRFAVGVGLIGALAAVFWIVERNTGWEGLDPDARAAAQARFSEEASRIAEKPVTIRCDESGRNVGVVQHADGVAAVGGDLAYLTPQRCLDLYRLAFEGDLNGSRTARALAVLAHEAWHLHGVADEATTECYALQSAVGLGRRLGLSADTARQLMRQQLVENLDSPSSPEYLVPRDCRDGGTLDLDPGSTRFP